MNSLPEKTEGSIRYLVFDTETTGLPDEAAGKKPHEWRESDPALWPELLQLAAEVWDVKDGVHTQVGDVFNWWINIEGEVPEIASGINGITKAFLDGEVGHGKSGEILESAAKYFPEVKDEILAVLNDDSIDFIVAHNMPYDEWIMRKNLQRHGDIDSQDDLVIERNGYEMVFDTTIETKELCRMIWDESGELKRPRLEQLYGILFPGKTIDGAHDARPDVAATVKVIKELHKREIFDPEFIKRIHRVWMQDMWVDWARVDDKHKSGKGWKVVA